MFVWTLGRARRKQHADGRADIIVSSAVVSQRGSLPRASSTVGIAALLLSSLTLACGGESTPPSGEEGDAVDVLDVSDITTGDVADTADTSGPCPGAALLCGDTCVDPLTDEAHCGSCATSCTPGDECVDGRCACPAGEQRCGFTCVDTQTDNDHCGQCDRVCGADEVCSTGECVTTCAEGLVNCAGDCVDIRTDDDHCGACEQVCEGDANEEASCAASVCVVGCIDGFYNLDGSPGCEYACPAATPSEEVCDGVDNDCDNLRDGADPSMVVPLCERQLGVCAGAETECRASAPAPCTDEDYTAHSSAYVAGEEVSCDGEDNDCDGEVDEGCCASDLVVLTPVDDPDAIDVTVFQTYNLFDGDDSVTVFTGSRFPASYPELDFGVLGVDGGHEVGVWTVAGEDSFGTAIATDLLGSDLVWWISTPVGVQTGQSDRTGELDAPFQRVLAGQLSSTPFVGVQQAHVADITYMVGLNRREGDRLPRLRAIVLNADTTAGPEDWDLDITPASDGLAAWGTADRFFVCATRLIETQRAIHCYALNTDLELLNDFAFADLPAHDQIRPFAPHADGSAAIYGVSRPTICDDPCAYEILELRITPEGTSGSRPLGITAIDGVMDVYAGQNEHWLFAKQADDEAESGTVLALYRVTADDLTQVARFEGADNDRVVGVVVRDGFPHAILPVPNAALDNPAMVAVPLSVEGAPLCDGAR